MIGTHLERCDSCSVAWVAEPLTTCTPCRLVAARRGTDLGALVDRAGRAAGSAPVLPYGTGARRASDQPMSTANER